MKKTVNQREGEETVIVKDLCSNEPRENNQKIWLKATGFKKGTTWKREQTVHLLKPNISVFYIPNFTKLISFGSKRLQIK